MSLVARIQNGEFPVDSLIPSYRQLAEDYNVSTISVLKALEILQQKGFVEKKRGRGKGTQVISTTGLTDEPASSSSRKNIVFCSGFGSHPYILSVLEGVTTIASEEGCTFKYIGLSNSTDERKKILSVLDQDCDGLIVYPFSGEENLDLFTSLVEQNFPMVLLDRYFPQIKTDCVLNEDEQGAFALTQALIHQGHRRIAIVHMQRNEGKATSVSDRIQGYQRALRENSIPYEEALLWQDIYQQPQLIESQTVTRKARDLLSRRVGQHRPTAFLVINQDTAQRVALDLYNLQSDLESLTPDDQYAIQNVKSLATFSFTDQLSLGNLDLILAVQAGKEMGCQAAQLLIERISNPETIEKRTFRIPITIVSVKGGEQTR